MSMSIFFNAWSKSFLCLLISFCFALSILLKIIAKGIPSSAKTSINSISIFCGGILASIKTKTIFNVSLWVKKSWIIFIHCFLEDNAAFAYPYPGKSTRCRLLTSSSIRKKLINWVLPGFTDDFANLFWLVSILITEDFPTFDLQIKAISGKSDTGHWLNILALVTKLADLIFIIQQITLKDFIHYKYSIPHQ